MICDFRSQQIDSSTHRTLPITDLGKCVTPGWGVAVGAAILALAEAGSCAANCPFLRLPASPASPHSGRARHWSPVTTFGRTSLVRPWPRTSDLGLHISFPLSCYLSPVTTFGRTSLVRSWTSDLILYLVPALSVFLSALTLPPMGFLSVANSCHPLFSSTSPGSPSYRYGRQPDRLRRLTKCPHSGDFVFQGRPKASLRAIRKVQG